MRLLLLLLTACDTSEAAAGAAPKAGPKAEASPTSAEVAPVAAPAGVLQGTVKENLVAGAYTYTRIDAGDGKEVWAAAPGAPPTVGTTVLVPTGLPMENFHSDTLSRDFPVVYFAEALPQAGAKTDTIAKDGTMPDWHPKLTGDEECGPVKPGAPADLEAALVASQGGVDLTHRKVAEIWAQRTTLSGQKIAVTGQVVKYTAEVMGKNWVHVRDGSGAEGSNDLTITTSGAATVGDTVLVTGTIAVDQDFGYGYKYGVIVADATVTALTSDK